MRFILKIGAGKVENDSVKDGLFSPFMNVTSNQDVITVLDAATGN